VAVTKPNRNQPNPRFFFQSRNRTEVQKSILHIPILGNLYCRRLITHNNNNNNNNEIMNDSCVRLKMWCVRDRCCTRPVGSGHRGGIANGSLPQSRTLICHCHLVNNGTQHLLRDVRELPLQPIESLHCDTKVGLSTFSRWFLYRYVGQYLWILFKRLICYVNGI